MRANITYSVEVDKIPDEIERIIENERCRLNLRLSEIENAILSKNYTDAREKILNARQSLGNADIRLYEVDSIMSGYIEAVNGTEEELTHEEVEVPEEPTDESG